MQRRKILIATGGTGGHVFPAEALGFELKEKGYDVLFVGSGLKTNRYFHQDKFSFHQIESATPFRGNFFKSIYYLGRGIWQSLHLLKEFGPDLVMGFGSYHSFPALMAAKLKKIPLALFIPDAIPGRVNRFFSKWALFSAVQFSQAGAKLHGSVREVKMPMVAKKIATPGDAKEFFYLDRDLFTFLVFGGSQGSSFINQLFAKTCLRLNKPFQVIHIAGTPKDAEVLGHLYEEAKIKACVKAFEERMELAWSAADVAICRSGAVTLAEQMAHGVPAILIPFAQAMDDHQTKNAEFIKEVGGAVICPEMGLTEETFYTTVLQMMEMERLQEMKEAMAAFRQDEQKPRLSKLVEEAIL